MNDHVAEPFRTILNDFAGEKKHLQGQAVKPRPVTYREKYKIAEQIHAELVAAGCVIEPGQFFDAILEYQNGLRDLEGGRQYDYERNRS